MEEIAPNLGGGAPDHGSVSGDLGCARSRACPSPVRPGRAAWAVRTAGVAALLLLVAGCAGANPNVGAGTDPAGFLLGVVHGLVAVVAFVASLFTDVGVYEVHNTGAGYDLGFLLGVGAFAGGAASR